MIKYTVILIATLFVLNAFGQKVPTGVKFNISKIERKGNYGDNWCQTWAADGHIYTMLDDGNGWWGEEVKTSKRVGWEGSMCLRIKGGPDFDEKDVVKMKGWPQSDVTSSFYAYGTISVDSVIYVWLWKSESDTWYRRPIANRLLYTTDFGETFYRWDGKLETEETFEETDSTSFFFYKEDPTWKNDRNAYAFNWIAFCQNGKDNAAAKDNYVYMYAPEQKNPRELSVIRVNKNHIKDKSEYEYFKGWNGQNAEWTKDLTQRGINLQYPEAPDGQEWMWASWFPSVVYNPGFDKYIMVSYGVTDPGKEFWDGWCSKCKYPASLGFWHSDTPYGPWTQFHYTEYFYADREVNRTYGFKLSPKWISDNGKKMVLIWSDASDGHSTNYKWNQMDVEILTD